MGYLSGLDGQSIAHRVLDQCLVERDTIASQQIVQIAPANVSEEIQQHLSKPPRSPRPVETVLESARAIYQDRVRMDHPRFFGFIPSPASDLSWLGEVLNSAYNPHAGSWMQSSGPSAVEKQLLEWMARDVVGFPATAGGCFVSGGSMANLSALMVARDQKLDFEQRGRAVAYVSNQTHSSISKGLKILGFHQSQVRKVPCDAKFRYDVEALRLAIAEDRKMGKIPFLVVGSCGTTNTGAIDPLSELAAIARAENMWFHVDGAYGASALLCQSRKSLFQGIDQCDSLSWDAHKWLFQTYGCGMVLMRDRNLLVDSFGVSAEYFQDAAETGEALPNFWNYGPELTRPARAMKLWFSLQMLGLDKIEQDIEHGFRLAEVAEQTLRGLEDWEISSPAQLGVVCFRYRPQGEWTPEAVEVLNQKISQAAIEENLAAPLTTRLNGVLVLRICSIHPELSTEEIASVVHGLDRIAKSLSQRSLGQSADVLGQ